MDKESKLVDEATRDCIAKQLKNQLSCFYENAAEYGRFKAHLWLVEGLEQMVFEIEEKNAQD